MLLSEWAFALSAPAQNPPGKAVGDNSRRKDEIQSEETLAKVAKIELRNEDPFWRIFAMFSQTQLIPTPNQACRTQIKKKKKFAQLNKIAEEKL